MKTINIHEAKTHLSRILARVARGESVVIGKAGTPVAVLSPYVPADTTRAPGSMKGRIQIAADFDADDNIIADLFEGSAEKG
ncbi:MAG: type II toxin-antitoxin system prevent-host-death family antitoxin [Rhodothermales bacterium]|jgi:prevent-host-death family protein